MNININGEMVAVEGVDMGGAYEGDSGMTEGTIEGTSNGTLLASYPFVIGVSGAVLVFSIVIGILLAKKRIKKGIDLYED